MTISIDNSNHTNGSMALRNYLNELFLEKTGANATIGDSDYKDSSAISVDSDVSLSSDEESVDDNNEDYDEDENDVSDPKTNSTTNNNDLNAITNHTRRRRFRHSRSNQNQRPLFAVTADNARGVRGAKHTFGGELRVSTYQNNLSSTSNMGTGLQTSASAHSYSSLGSRTGISNTSVSKWRITQQKARSAMISRNQHRDSRWSTTGNDIPKGSLSKQSNNNKIKSYDFGFVNDSLHSPSSLRKKNKINNNRRGSSNKTLRKSKTEKQTTAERFSCRKVIDSAFRVVKHSDSSGSDSEAEFYEDDDVSLSSFTMDTFDDSKTSKTSSVGSSLNFGNNYRVKSKAMQLPPCRVAPARARSVGDMPRLPRRTMDESFDLNDWVKSKTMVVPPCREAPTRTHSVGEMPRLPRRSLDDSLHWNNDSASETFEALKGGSVASITSISSHGGFQKTKVLRSKSSDSFMTMSLSSNDFDDKPKRRGSDPFGRWGATTRARSKDIDSSLKCPVPPRRIPSTSRSNLSTGRNSNHSNDSSEPSESETDSNASFDFNNSFAGCPALDDSMATTVTTTGSLHKDHNSDVTQAQNDVLKILLPAYSSHHSSRMMNIVPESLRTLPNNSYHGSSTISSKSLAGRKYHGKSLHSASRKWT